MIYSGQPKKELCIAASILKDIAGYIARKPLNLSRLLPPHFRGPFAKTTLCSYVRAPSFLTCGFLDGLHICIHLYVYVYIYIYTCVHIRMIHVHVYIPSSALLETLPVHVVAAVQDGSAQLHSKRKMYGTRLFGGLL